MPGSIADLLTDAARVATVTAQLIARAQAHEARVAVLPAGDLKELNRTMAALCRLQAQERLAGLP